MFHEALKNCQVYFEEARELVANERAFLLPPVHHSQAVQLLTALLIILLLQDCIWRSSTYEMKFESSEKLLRGQITKKALTYCEQSISFNVINWNVMDKWMHRCIGMRMEVVEHGMGYLNEKICVWEEVSIVLWK